MKTCYPLAACFLLCSLTVRGADSKSLLELSPTVTELGEGWTPGQVIYLVDPLSRPSEMGSEELVKVTREMMERTGREAYLRINFGHRTMTNHACQVYLQRWPTTEALINHKYRKNPLVDKTPPTIGQEAYWSGGPHISGLNFRLDQYLVVIEAWASDDANLLRLARVIEAKLAGKPIPQETGDATKRKP